MSDARVTTSAPALRVAGALLLRSLGRLTRSTRFQTAALEIGDGSVRLSFTEQERYTVIDLAADTEGTCRVVFAPRLLANIVGALPRGSVTIHVLDDTIEIESGRSSFEIWCRDESYVTATPLGGGLSFDRGAQMTSLRRIVRATAGARHYGEDVRLRFRFAEQRLEMAFDTFEIAATDTVQRTTGELPNGLLVTSADEFDDALALFDETFPQLRLAASSSRDELWLAGRHRRQPVELSTRVPLWRQESRDPARLEAGGQPHRVTIDARSLRSALRRGVISADGLGDGPYVWLRLGAEADRMRVLMHGWSASSAEWVECESDGPAVDIALSYLHLASAIRHVPGDITLSYGDPSKPVVIEAADAYRCVLRPLPPAAPDSPPHRTFFQNVPFPD